MDQTGNQEKSVSMHDNKIRVALIYPQGLHNVHLPLPPLGLAYLIKHYQTHSPNKDKVEFRIFGENAERRDLIDTVIDYHPHIAGITALSFTKTSADRCATQLRARQPDLFIVGGGVHFQVCPADGLREKRYDVVCTGEGEEPFMALIDDYFLKNLKTENLADIPSISWIGSDGTIQQSGKRYVADLANMPVPDYEHFFSDYYFAPRYSERFHKYTSSASVITSRGCPFSCSFCFNSFRDRTVRKHDINAVIELMIHLRNKFNVTNFAINDDLFLMDRQRVTLFCNRLIKDLPEIRWGCQARPSLLRDDDLPLFKLMQRSGCFQLAYGLETGCEELLKKLKGNDSSIAKNRLALELAWQAGISVFGFFMCGIPGETEEQMAMTGDFIKVNLARMRLVELFIYTPYPGSKLAEEVQNLGLLDGVTIDELSMNNLVEGKIRVFNPAMPAENVLKFRKEIKKLVMHRHPFKDKLRWLFVNITEDPIRTFRRLKALYG